MEYSLPVDIQKEFSDYELAVLTGDPTGVSIDWDRHEWARTNADSTIDTYLRGVYDVPFADPIYHLIRKLSVDLTVVNLYEYAYKDSAIPNTIVWKRIYAIKMLKDIRDRVIKIEQVDSAFDYTRTIYSNRTSSERIFNDDVLAQFFDGE